LSFAGRSSDWQMAPLRFVVAERHKSVINLRSRAGRRYSVVTECGDMGPRSVLSKRLPDWNVGEDVTVFAEALPVCYDPEIPTSPPSRRWRPLWLEWLDFLAEPPLDVVGKELIEGGLSSVAGMGPGLTPAGDDLLAGYMTATKLRGETVPAQIFPERDTTTWLSFDILRDAFAGLVWRRIKGLCDALAGERASLLEESLISCLAMGHTSGKAYLAGMALGFEV